MTNERYQHLFNTDGEKITPEENAMGWHWCDEFDGLLVGPTVSEWHCCTCWERILKLQCEKRCEAAGWTLATKEWPGVPV